MSDVLTNEKYLDPEVKSKWLGALRSGEYRQTTGRLMRDCEGGVAHCCLGVLGEVCGITFDPDNGYLWEDDDDPEAMLLYATQDKLADMNDDGCSFKVIADWIDEHIPAAWLGYGFAKFRAATLTALEQVKP